MATLLKWLRKESKPIERPSDKRLFVHRVAFLKQNQLILNACKMTNNPREALNKVETSLSLFGKAGADILFSDDYPDTRKAIIAAIEQIFLQKRVSFYSKN